MRKAYGNPVILEEIAESLITKIPSDTTCIACSGLGGIPLGTILSNKTNLPLVIVRDKEKDHGDQKIIEGYLPNDKDKTLIVDDVFSSGTGVSKIIKNLQETNCEILKILVIIKRGESNLAPPLNFLYTEKDLTSAV